MLQLHPLEAAYYIRLIFELITQTLFKRTTIIYQESSESLWFFEFVVLLGGWFSCILGFLIDRVCIMSHLLIYRKAYFYSILLI